MFFIIYLLSLTCNLAEIQRIEIGQSCLLTRGNAGTMTPLVALSRGFCGPKTLDTADSGHDGSFSFVTPLMHYIPNRNLRQLFGF